MISKLPESLEETISDMTSQNYKERLRAEYQQTKIRYEKLKNFCNRIEAARLAGKEEPKHDCPIKLLKEQQRFMGMYLHTLEVRAIIEEVELL